MPDPTLKFPDLASSNDRDLNVFFQHQGEIARILGDLSYPIHRFIALELARSRNKEHGPYDAAEYTRDYLRKARLPKMERQRTGSLLSLNHEVEVPHLERGPLQHLALLIEELDEQRGTPAYEAAAQAFVAAYLRGFSYSISLAIHSHVAPSPVIRGGPELSSAAQWEAVGELKRLFAENQLLVARLINTNLGLVAEYTKRFAAKLGGDFAAMQADGRTGLCDGIYRYTPYYRQRDGQIGSATGLGGIAAAWIQHHIRRSLQHNSRTISVPVTTQQLRSIIGRIPGDGATRSLDRTTEELLLYQRAREDREFDRRLKTDRAGLLAELRRDERWWEEVDRTMVRVADATNLPTTVPLEPTRESPGEAEPGAAQPFDVALSTPAPTGDIERRELRDHVYRAIDDLPPNQQLILVFTFNLPTARTTSRRYLEDVIGQSTSSTRLLRETVGSRAPARIELMDGAGDPAGDDARG
jgi:DNA-directed RNA polymerase specialized sigma subunit